MENEDIAIVIGISGIRCLDTEKANAVLSRELIVKVKYKINYNDIE